ncbi:sulfite exporter TauE/SafE family protein [uncultured Idiomarina sp.]|uniref:sulfite exporter TauE/SafE family protein n=1 Tax=uncultured Idiomarina sp. TaxID=352961 RepID=UPI00259569A5|nr:sulfite exporter TauE/SafE family protein [uncultured Idiomarina sp.]
MEIVDLKIERELYVLIQISANRESKPVVSESLFYGLVLLSAATSLLSAVAGAGGGAVLIGVIALVLPGSAVIPVHGLVQMGSNVGRAALSWRHIHWPTIAWFVPFGLLGTFLGSLLLVQLPTEILQITIGLFLLWLTWGPKLPQSLSGRAGLVGGGLLTGFLALFVGASGPLVAAFVKARFSERMQTVATFAAVMTFQHGPKAIVFGMAGFVFKDWLPLIGAMIAAGFVGTWIGLHWLKKITNQRFDQLFRMIITLLALRLLWVALEALIPTLSGVAT